MTNLTPPPLPQKKRGIGVVAILGIALLLFVVLVFAIPAMLGSMMIGMMAKESRLSIKLLDDQFSVTILEVKSEPKHFTEKVRVRCEKDMDVDISVADLKNVGFFEIHGTNGETLYQQGNPYKIGQSSPVKTKDGFATCDISFSIDASSNNTTWHSEVSGATCETSLREALEVSNIQTNWPGKYNRGSSIPLADIGNYKILLSIK
jgi:hypothetical protein